MSVVGKGRNLTLSRDEKKQPKGLRDDSKPKGLAKDSPPDYHQLSEIVKNMLRRVDTTLESLHYGDKKLSDSDVELAKRGLEQTGGEG